MDTLRDKIINAMCGKFTAPDGVVIDAADAIMSIIENHIEWSDPDDCQYGHVYSGVCSYEITDGFTLYDKGTEMGEYDTLDEAKQAAQAHKEGRG